MGLIDFFTSFFDKDNKINSLKSCGYGLDGNVGYLTLLMATSINLIAKTLSRAEFQTYEQGKEIKKTNYYILNVEPNSNISATRFWQEVVKKLLIETEVLILLQNNQLYLADSFNRQEKVFVENIYTEVSIGDYPLNDTWYENKVLYLKNDNKQIQQAISNIYKDFTKLINASIKGYQNSKARKGKLKIPTNLPKELEDSKALQEHIHALMKDFMDPAKDAVYPEDDGFEYTEIVDSKGSKSNDSGRETKNFVNDIADFIAMGYGIPPSLLKGDTVDTKDAVNNFLTFCINPIAKLIQDEINRKMYRIEGYRNNNYVKVDTSNIKAVDLRDIANSIDLLNRNAALTINDILRILGKEPLDDNIGSLRFITKNYEVLDKVFKDGSISNAGGD